MYNPLYIDYSLRTNELILGPQVAPLQCTHYSYWSPREYCHTVSKYDPLSVLMSVAHVATEAHVNQVLNHVLDHVLRCKGHAELTPPPHLRAEPASL